MGADVIKDILMKCYEEFFDNKDDANMMTFSPDEIEVKEMTPADIERPRSRCWKLSVPSNVKNVFEDECFYPSSWRFRQFFPPRSSYLKRRKSNVEGDDVSDHLLSGKGSW